MNQIKVVKRNGTTVPVNFEKVLNRIEKQSYKLDMDYIQPFEVAKKVLMGIYDGVTTRELDVLATETAAALTSIHPDYAKLAARLAVSALHKDTEKSFSKTVTKLHSYINPETNLPAPLVSDEFNEIVQKNASVLDAAVIHSRDLDFDYFGYKTMAKSYLLKTYGKVVERPQYMIMRTAVAIHREDIESALKTYELMSAGYFTHATPTLFNAGTVREQLSSCYLLKIQGDSIDKIYETLTEAALISKNAGGIGIAVSNIRASGSYIAGTNGTSNGLVPMLKVFNETARYVDQCFTPNTTVETQLGSKAISEISVGDKVKTANGEYNSVKTTKSFEYIGELITIKAGGKEVQVTPQHPFLVVRDCTKNSAEQIKQKLKLGIIKPEWLDAKDLHQSDIILSY